MLLLLVEDVLLVALVVAAEAKLAEPPLVAEAAGGEAVEHGLEPETRVPHERLSAPLSVSSRIRPR
jgi:hypothetical protein